MIALLTPHDVHSVLPLHLTDRRDPTADLGRTDCIKLELHLS